MEGKFTKYTNPIKVGKMVKTVNGATYKILFYLS